MRILIVDDEPLARARLRGLLTREGDIEVIGEAENGQDALYACDVRNPDLLLLDIHMPGMDGLDVARQLAQKPAPPLIVFCTAYDNHALSAFEHAALDYLVKPVRPERLSLSLQRARERLGQQPAVPATQQVRSQLCARLGGHMRLIPVSNILYMQAEEKYVVVHHSKGQDLVDESLKSLEEEFGERFLRIHRNCLVARHALKELRRDPAGHAQVLLQGVEKPLDVSRRSLPDLKRIMQSWG